MEAPYCDMMKEICVMLVDHDKDFVIEMIDLLQFYKYKVRTANVATEGISMLSKGKDKIDVMIINVNSPDLLSFCLLEQAIALDIVPLFVCDKYDPRLAKKAFENGAYLHLEKPIHQEIVKYLWQFVWKKKLQKKKTREGLIEKRDHKNDDVIDKDNFVGDNEKHDGEKNNVPINIEEQSNNIHETKKDVVSNENCELRRKRDRQEISEGETQSIANKAVKRKDCTEWTVGLHAKFVEAVHQLGEGRCVPKKILDVMNVPGLTRHQVASHLQKCRNNNWRVTEEQKSTCHRSGQLESSNGSVQRCNLKFFETIPNLQINGTILEQQQHNQETPIGPEFPFPPNNNIFARGESSTLQQAYQPQLQVDNQYLSSFNTSFLSLAKNNNVGGLQRQHGSLFEMMGSHGPNIGSDYYSSGVEFQNREHHTQDDYDLNVAIYSIMSGANIENATINGLGVANANFQQYIGDSNMCQPNNFVTTSHASDTEVTESTERINCDAYLDFSNMDYLVQNQEPPTL